VSFSVGADAYDRFMGRYSVPLAPVFAEFGAVIGRQPALDVGCGPGALTGELVKCLGPAAVSAVDPSDAFVTAVLERYPGVDARRATAEALPFDDESSTPPSRSLSSTSWPSPSPVYAKWHA
jgi:trans-aconitate methyltransferase